jgi:hypothetical protein
MATVVEDSYYKSENKLLPYKWASPEVLKFGKYSTASGTQINCITYKLQMFGHLG